MCTEIPFLRYIKKYHFPYHFKDVSAWDAGKLMTFYNKMDVVLEMRGHVRMIPFGVNCQIISLGTHEKMKWFLEDIDAIDWGINITNQPETLAERIVDKFVDIHEVNSEETSDRLLKAQKKLWQITCLNMGKIKDALK